MQIIIHPPFKDWKKIVARPTFDNNKLFVSAQAILDDVRQRGDRAVFEYGERFDHVILNSLAVSPEEIAAAGQLVPSELKNAIRIARQNIEKFHESQRISIHKIETSPGVVCWQKAVGIQKVGLYIPGGNAPLFSTVLMLAIPAHIAGCGEIVLCTPPRKDGSIHPAILFAAKEAGVDKIFKIGGIQAIAAMAYGTESVPKVYKIAGPGNQYVTVAKQLASLADVAIDMPAGPSEVEVIADHLANPAFIAADLLSQAEHGTDSQAILVTTSEDMAHRVGEEVQRQLASLPRREAAAQSIENSRMVVLKDQQEVIDFTNFYAPEHLIIQTSDYRDIAEKIINAGSVFLGPYTPESAGDYASGTNHTLPTNGFARMYNGVNVDTFTKKITFQEISKEGIENIGPIIETMAEAESLHAHQNAVRLRRGL